MILDSNFLIALQAGDSGAEQKAAAIEGSGVPTRIPSVVVQELYTGVGAGTTPILTQRQYEAMMAAKPIVPLNGKIARRAGAINGYHHDHQHKPDLGLADSVIAATGLTYNEPVVSEDSDLATVEGLTVESF